MHKYFVFFYSISWRLRYRKPNRCRSLGTCPGDINMVKALGNTTLCNLLQDGGRGARISRIRCNDTFGKKIIMTTVQNVTGPPLARQLYNILPPARHDPSLSLGITSVSVCGFVAAVVHHPPYNYTQSDRFFFYRVVSYRSL